MLRTLELVPLGCLGTLDGCGHLEAIFHCGEASWCRRGDSPNLVVFGAQSLWCKAPGKRRGLQLGCGDRPEQIVRVR